VPETIIYDLWNDPTLEYRVGAGMWWISGKTSYQPDLVAVLSDFPGDIYGQVIGKSGEGPWKPNTSYRRRDIRMPDPQLLTNAFRYEVIVAGESGDTQPDWPTTNGATVEDGTVVWKCRSSRFEGGDYTSVFAQAKEIGMRYIEPWEWEFKYGDNSANGVWNAALTDFNNWADSVYNQNLTPPEIPTGLIATAGNAQVELDWDDNVELDLLGYIVYRSLNAGGPYEAVNAGLLSASEYIDDTVANDTTYYYVVTAADASANESGDSSEVSATPSEGNGPVTLLKDGFESDFSLWAGDGATDWTRVTEQARTGVYSANAGSDSNDLVSNNLDASGLSSMTIEFWYRDSYIDGNDNVFLQLFSDDGSYYDEFELGVTWPQHTWQFYTLTIENSGDDAQYFHANFRVKIEGSSIDSGENLWVDDVHIYGTLALEVMEGDLSGDGTVDGTDLQMLRGAMRTSAGDPGFLPDADLDEDGLISFYDYRILYNIISAN